MSSRGLRIGLLGPIAVCVLVVLALVVPLADAMVFGIHDHETAFEPDGSSSGREADSRADDRHHCDLGMNPAEVAPASDLPAPGSAPAPPLGTLRRATVVRPFVPYTPPRA
jgi:hypothetical protein